MACVPAKIRTGHLLNISLNGYYLSWLRMYHSELSAALQQHPPFVKSGHWEFSVIKLQDIERLAWSFSGYDIRMFHLGSVAVHVVELVLSRWHAVLRAGLLASHSSCQVSAGQLCHRKCQCSNGKVQDTCQIVIRVIATDVLMHQRAFILLSCDNEEDGAAIQKL